MSRKGPFGLWMGMTLSDFEDRPRELSTPYRYITSVVPKPHSAFESYALQIPPQAGLSWIKAIGTNVSTNGYGTDLKNSFGSMANKLNRTYGKSKQTDLHLAGCVWSEPQYWMQALLSKERYFSSEWSKETGAVLSDGLVSVWLMVAASDTSTGFLNIEYLFDNHTVADAEVAALEDDAL